MNYSTGTTLWTCDLRVSGVVSVGSSQLVLDIVDFTNCSIAGIDLFLRTSAAAFPWEITPVGLGPSSYGLTFGNYLTSTTTVNCDNGTPNALYEDTYRFSTATPTGVSFQNGTSGPFVPSKISGLNVGPMERIDNNSCSLPSPMGIRGTLLVTQVGGAPVTAANNPVVIP